MEVLGIDIGGTGIKGNLVDPENGALLAKRFKIPTPKPSDPEAVAEVVLEMVRHFDYSGRVGCTFPAVVRRGVTLSAANVDKQWIGTDAAGLFSERTGLAVTVLNDADAAGMAEMAFGAGKGRSGVVLVLTFGTGIGSGLFIDGVLVPNTELGHLQFGGYESVETWTSAKVMKSEGLSFKAWGKRVDAYLEHLRRLFSPDLVIVGGGVSRKWDEFSAWITVDMEVVPATFANEAGIVGAAMAAQLAG